MLYPTVLSSSLHPNSNVWNTAVVHAKTQRVLGNTISFRSNGQIPLPSIPCVWHTAIAAASHERQKKREGGHGLFFQHVLRHNNVQGRWKGRSCARAQTTQTSCRAVRWRFGYPLSIGSCSILNDTVTKDPKPVWNEVWKNQPFPGGSFGGGQKAVLFARSVSSFAWIQSWQSDELLVIWVMPTDLLVASIFSNIHSLICNFSSAPRKAQEDTIVSVPGLDKQNLFMYTCTYNHVCHSLEWLKHAQMPPHSA